MRVIHKFPLERQNEQIVKMPQGANIVHVGLQNGTACLWATVDPQAPMSDIKIRVYPTGVQIDQNSFHIGTFITPSGRGVFHVFRGL